MNRALVRNSSDFREWQEEVAAQGCCSPVEFEDLLDRLPVFLFWHVQSDSGDGSKLNLHVMSGVFTNDLLQ